MIENIQWNGVTIGIFLPRDHSPAKTQFVTPLDEPLQLGIGVFKQDAKVEPHRHVGSPAKIVEFQEFISIRKGRAMAQVYDPEGKLLREIEMLPGDALLLLRGGHAFHFLEETEILEVKQGPYLGRENMKQLLGAPAKTPELNLTSPPASPELATP